MSFAWQELYPTAGKKTLAIHETGDGVLITLHWRWPENNIAQEIVFFSPLDQAHDIAEEILNHVDRLDARSIRLRRDEDDDDGA